MGLIDIFRRPARSSLSFDEWLSYFTYNGIAYPFAPSYTLQGDKEDIEASFTGYVDGAYKSDGVVFACLLVRQLFFSEARFQFRRLEAGRPGDLFGSPALQPLERPTPQQTTGDFLARAMQDADLAGNFYAVRRPGNRIKRLRPDWVTIVLGSESGSELDVDVLGYLYHPGGKFEGKDPIALLPEQVAHFAPIPDPIANFRGMSWLTPVLREIMADRAATTHKIKFFENGATPNLAVKFDPEVTEESFKAWVALFKEQHEGASNAYKTLFLGGGADVTPVGADFRQIDFKATQGAGETRIAAAAGVPPVIVGLSEGLEAATYSNYQLAMRRFADLTMRPLWRNISGSLSTIIEVPSGAELWYDDRDIPALAQNEKDEAEIQQLQATAIRTLLDAGFDADSAVQGVLSGDLGKLKHSGLFSVQLQPAGTAAPSAAETNGSVPAELVPQP